MPPGKMGTPRREGIEALADPGSPESEARGIRYVQPICEGGKTLAAWLGGLTHRFSGKIDVRVNTEDRFSIRLYLPVYYYTISVHERLDGTAYLGAMASLRAPYPGEDHLRGNDLPDGELSIELLHAILACIVFFEAEQLGIPARHK